MSGPKQHYIPQSFQRSFKIQEKSKVEKIWCYRVNQSKGFLAPIGDLAAERYFYSDPPDGDGKTLDDAITAYENRLAHLLRILRSEGQQKSEPLNEVAAEVISHLTFRAKSVRHFMNEAVTGIVEKLRGLIQYGFDVEQFPAAPMGEALEKNLGKMMKDKAADNDIVASDLLLARVAYAYARENADSILENADQQIQTLADMFVQNDKNYSREHHAKAMNEMFPAATYGQLSDLNWKIVQIKSGQLILPDCIGIASQDGVKFQPLLGGMKDAEFILVPITRDKILTGTKGLRFDFCLSKFNQFAASCSSELFLSSANAVGFSNLQSTIGTSLKSMVSDAMDSAASELAQDYVPPTATPNEKLEHTISGGFEITVSFSSSLGNIYSRDQLIEQTERLIGLLEPNDIRQIEKVYFDDPDQSCNEYSERLIDAAFVNGAVRMRHDSFYSILSSESDSEKHSIHLKQDLIPMLLNEDQRHNAESLIQYAVKNMIFTKIFSEYEAGHFQKIEEILVPFALQSLRVFSIESDTHNAVASVETIRLKVQDLWNFETLNDLAKRHSNASSALTELLERMSASLAIMADYARQNQNSLEQAATDLCDAPEFKKWFLLFAKDMQLAAQWLDGNKTTDAVLIPAAHLERLLFGMGLSFETDDGKNVTYQYRDNFTQSALPVPFETILVDTA